VQSRDRATVGTGVALERRVDDVGRRRLVREPHGAPAAAVDNELVVDRASLPGVRAVVGVARGESGRQLNGDGAWSAVERDDSTSAHSGGQCG